MVDALLVGLSALQAHQRAIEVTSHNIANATTPGYTRQRAELATLPPENATPGQIGRGVDVDAIHRLANELLVERLRQAQSEQGRLDQLGTTLKTAEMIFNEPGDNGLSAVIDKLFASFEDLASNPESAAQSAITVTGLETFTDAMNNLGSRLQTLRDDLRPALEDEVAQVNQLTTSIRDLNQQIRSQTLLGNNANDLMDRRETLINQLSSHLDLRVRREPSDGTVMIDSGGMLLVGRDYAEQLSVGGSPDGSLTLLASNKVAVAAKGGSIGALFDLHDTILPALQSAMDTMASTLATELNARQATGTSSNARFTTFTSAYSIAPENTDLNLDDAAQVQGTDGGPGLPKVFLPSFTDANGNAVARNLTINVYDPATGVARKYTVRYDPTTGGGTRSLDDLVSVINTGRSSIAGGFTLYPPNAGGIADVVAKKVQVDGGYKLELTARNGQTIDFSPALDTQPTAQAWTGAGVTVTGGDPALAGQRVVFRVVGGNLQAFTRSPVDGTESAYGAPLSLAASGAIGGLNVALAGVAASYHNGESFAVDLDASGAVAAGSFTQAKQWTAGDAAMTVRGRYTGEVAFAPGREWSMRVVSTGTIGAATGAPLVEFTYYTGSADAPVAQTVQKVLDDTVPAGTPVMIADGVYVVFGAGTLSTAGNQVAFTVAAQSDQARLLPALGIDGMLTGSTAATLRVATALKQDPTRLAVGATRAAGDNANVLDLAAVRQDQVFGAGAFTVEDFYHTTLTGLGARIQQTQSLSDNQNTLTQSLENQRQQVSGVSIDEEVSNLILEQQAYTAAARVITMTRENIATLMDMIR